MRNMSFALTVPQIQAGTKDVTRRLGWLHLKPGDQLSPVLKGMGLKPGEKIVRLRDPIHMQLQREKDHNAAARQVGLTEVAFEVEVHLGGQGGIVPLLRSDGRHRSVPLGRYVCIRVP